MSGPGVYPITRFLKNHHRVGKKEQPAAPSADFSGNTV